MSKKIDCKRTWTSICASVGMVSVILIFGVAARAQAAIVVGHGIAGANLGDTEAQVVAALGEPTLKQPPSHNGSVEWNYAKAPLQGAMSFVNGALTGLWTSSAKEKTSKDIGPGSSLTQTKHAYPSAKCSTGPFGPKSVICVVRSRLSGKAVETAFVFYTRSKGAREVDIDFS